ncbi:MAG TPA: outer membrane beta-barrel protein, partial [Flavobacteriales bacterium]|nr:outer membrane beta-barrel protein [Flavobacteriales bacterium]
MRNTISRTTGLTLSALVLFTVTTASAQTQINPQLGLTYQNLTGKLVQGQDFKGSVGYTLGADLRFGNRLFFQPGVFLSRNRTISSYDGGNVIESESKLITTNLKLRALVGYRIIDSYQFDLRLVAGPSYDVLMSVDGKDNNGIAWNKGDFSTGSFNVE